MSPTYDAIVIALGGTSSPAARVRTADNTCTAARPVLGGILADPALTGTSEHPIGLFAPARLAAAPA